MGDNPDNPQGFTEELKRICQGRCGDMGEPACWELPQMVEPCELITPCDDCLSEIKMPVAQEFASLEAGLRGIKATPGEGHGYNLGRATRGRKRRERGEAP